MDELCNFLDEVDTGVGRGASPAHTKAGELVATGRRKAPLRSLFIRVTRPVHSRAGAFSEPGKMSDPVEMIEAFEIPQKRAALATRQR